jgi:hypothetical protein
LKIDLVVDADAIITVQEQLALLRETVHIMGFHAELEGEAYMGAFATVEDYLHSPSCRSFGPAPAGHPVKVCLGDLRNVCARLRMAEEALSAALGGGAAITTTTT